jgi:hypothetical protein
MGLTNDAKIQILLKEYDALRAEIISRTSNRFSSLGILAAVVAFSASQQNVLLAWIVGGAVGLLLFGVWLRLGYLIGRCSAQIANVEEQINALAGDDLLTWESRAVLQWVWYPARWIRRKHNSESQESPRKVDDKS